MMLREAIRPNRQRRPSGRFVTMPAPVAGLNFRDSIATLKPNEALVLDNWFAEASFCRLRRGYAEHVTGFLQPVHSLMEYASPTDRALFAAAGTNIFDATTAGAVGAAVVSGLTNAKWQHRMFTTSGGDYLVAVNGADGVRTYDGSTWATQAITVATAANFVDVAVWGNRLWFVENNSNKVWYLPSGAIAGAATALDLGPVFVRGGSVRIITPVSFNSGSLVEVAIAFISSEGEVAVYQGTDPASSSTFGLVGRFRIAEPVIGQRGYTVFNGDCLVLTRAGLVSLLSASRLAQQQQTNTSVSEKIDQELARQSTAQRTAFGWEVFSYPAGTAVFINAPQGADVFDQWVMNAITVAWSRYRAQNGFCWGLLNNEPYFGGTTAVYRADFGAADNSDAIRSSLKGAFSTFGTPDGKRVMMIRPHITSNSPVAPAIGVDLDFSDNDPGASAALSTVSAGVWNVSNWNEANWGGESVVQQEWNAVAGIGTWIAPRIATNSVGLEMQLNAFDLVVETSAGMAL